MDIWRGTRRKGGEKRWKYEERGDAGPRYARGLWMDEREPVDGHRVGEGGRGEGGMIGFENFVAFFSLFLFSESFAVVVRWQEG